MTPEEFLRLKLLGGAEDPAEEIPRDFVGDRAPAGVNYRQLKAESGAPNVSVKDLLQDGTREGTNTTTTRQGYKIPTSKEFEQLKALAPEFEDMNSYLYNQEQERKALKKKAEEFYSKPPETNYAPWLSLLDKWGGTNFASGYTQPKTAREQEEEGLKTQAALLKNANASTSEAGRMARMLGQTGDMEAIKNFMEKFTKASETASAGDQRSAGGRSGVEKDTADAYGKELEKADYTSSLDKIKALQSIVPNLFDKNALDEKLPGMNTSAKVANKLGSSGSLIGSTLSAVTGSLTGVTQDDQDFRSGVESLVTDLRKGAFGKTLTPNEARSFELALGTALTQKSDKRVRITLGEMYDKVSRGARSLEARFPKGSTEYRKRMQNLGVPIEQIPQSVNPTMPVRPANSTKDIAAERKEAMADIAAHPELEKKIRAIFKTENGVDL